MPSSSCKKSRTELIALTLSLIGTGGRSSSNDHFLRFLAGYQSFNDLVLAETFMNHLPFVLRIKVYFRLLLHSVSAENLLGICDGCAAFRYF
ncbi:hypothetical protein VTP01DRAFT_2233 [Rhizomucor pusillus]|uniref:uncharacterized protein n=1 Tax=Rhizomucor pusillus TaxID=4840 RepID=UPI003742A7E4